MSPSFKREKEQAEKENGRIYLDHAATTPVDEDVISAMQPYFSRHFGNPGSLHEEGRIAKETITDARETCANLLSCDASEIIFTGSGTESNNLAIWGVVQKQLEGGADFHNLHFVTTPIEHPSVLECFRKLQEYGANVTYIPVSEDGLVSERDVKDAIRHDTVLVSIMYVNNETGAILPVHEIGKAIDQYRKVQGSPFPKFHIDACQAAIFNQMHVSKLRADLLSLDGQKIYGPKGVGLLFKRNNVELSPLMYGGSQETGLRPGTENIPLIVGLSKALSIVSAGQEEEAYRLSQIRDYCIHRLEKDIPGVSINGPLKEKIGMHAPTLVNVTVHGQDAEFLAVALSEKGISVGTRSACMGEGGPSYVLEAMGKSDDAGSSLRFSFGKTTTKQDIDTLIAKLQEILANFDNN